LKKRSKQWKNTHKNNYWATQWIDKFKTNDRCGKKIIWPTHNLET
jgi:hypothetical protein